MGTKTLAGFRADLLLELGSRTDTTTTQQDQWINASYMDLTTRSNFWGLKVPIKYMFPELNVSSTAYTQEDRAYIDVPSNCLVTYTIVDTSNDNKLKNVGWRDYIRRTGRNDTDSSGEPTSWTRYGSYYYLYPTPDSAYNIEIYYRKRPTLLSATTDTTAIGTEWDEAILKLAVIQTMMRFKDYEKAEIEKKEWMDMMASRIGIYTQEMGDRGDYMKPDQGYHQWGYDR
jgi:hypothetical protein